MVPAFASKLSRQLHLRRNKRSLAFIPSMPAPRRGNERTITAELANQVIVRRPNNFVSLQKYYNSAELVLRQVWPPPPPPSPPPSRPAAMSDVAACGSHGDEPPASEGGDAKASSHYAGGLVPAECGRSPALRVPRALRQVPILAFSSPQTQGERIAELFTPSVHPWCHHTRWFPSRVGFSFTLGPLSRWGLSHGSS